MTYTLLSVVAAVVVTGLLFLVVFGRKLTKLQCHLNTSLMNLDEIQHSADNLRVELAGNRNLLHGIELDNRVVKEKLKAETDKLAVQEQQLRELRRERALVQQKYEGSLKNVNALTEQYTELKATLKERDVHHRRQLQQFSENKQALVCEFENLANKIFEEKGKTFTDASKSSIDFLLKPFREQIDGFQKRINDVHDASVRSRSELGAEIKKVLDIGLRMSSEAHNLTSALKGDSQKRGAWGEAQLKRTLEMSGLIENAHFEAQSSFKDQNGRQKQTDYLIKLPDEKHIIIDSKVSLVAYDRAISEEAEELKHLAMDEHINAVKKHIDELALKDYTNLIGMRSPSFVLMFMPIEPAYIDALRSSKDLFSYGYEKGIVLVSHTTLIPILRTVANLWVMERSTAEAREISDKAGEIYNQVCLVADRLQKLGGTLNTVSGHYNSAVKALAGQQGLYGKIERFNQLSSKVSKTLPVMEPIHIDFEIERLDMVVEPYSSDEEAFSKAD